MVKARFVVGDKEFPGLAQRGEIEFSSDKLSIGRGDFNGSKIGCERFGGKTQVDLRTDKCASSFSGTAVLRVGLDGSRFAEIIAVECPELKIAPEAGVAKMHTG